MVFIRNAVARRRRLRRLLLSTLVLPSSFVLLPDQAQAQFDPSSIGILAPSGVPLPGSPGNPFGGGAAGTTPTPGPAPAPGQNTPAAGGIGGGGGGGAGDVSSGRPPGFNFRAFGEVTEIYSTNGAGVGRGGGFSGLGGLGGFRTGPDFVTRMAVGFTVSDSTPRFQGSLNYTGIGFIFARNGALNSMQNFANGAAVVSLIPERLIVQGRAFAAPILVNQLGPISASGTPTVNGTNSGLRNTYGYTVAPSLLFRFGDYGNSNTTLTHQSIFFQRPGAVIPGATVPGVDAPLNFTSIGASQQFTTGDYFARLNMSLLGSYNKFFRTNSNFETRVAMLNTQYAVSRFFTLLATTGYQEFKTEAALTRKMAGLTLMGGAQFTAGPQFELTARGGTQFGYPSYTGNVRWEASPATVVVGALSDMVMTPAQRMFGGLGSLGFDGRGAAINTQYLLQGSATSTSAFTAAPLDQLGMGSLLSRYRMASLSLMHDDDRMHYRLTGFQTTRDILTVLPTGTSPRHETIGGQASVSRSVTPTLTAELSGTYWWYEISNSNYQIAMANLMFRQNLTEDLQLFYGATYLRRVTDRTLSTASPISASFSDVSISIGVRQEFF